MMILKPAYIIAIVAVAMIGVMVPITFAVTQLTINKFMKTQIILDTA